MSAKSYRQQFLEEFLKLYKVSKIEYELIDENKISGIAVYDVNDPEERQNFCWHMREENVPQKELLELIKIINENGWCDVDKITVSEDDLFNKSGWKNRDSFDKCFSLLFDIEIRMVDNGEETDGFFVHT